MDSNEHLHLMIGDMDCLVEPTPISGLTVSMALTFDGATLTFWSTGDPSPGDIIGLYAVSAGRIVAKLVVERQNTTIPNGTKFSIGHMDLALDALPEPYSLQIRVYAQRETTNRLHELSWEQGNSLHDIVIKDDRDFSKFVQNPATRLKNETDILYASVHCLGRFSGNYWISAGAVCVIGYRIIDGKSKDPRAASLFNTQLDRVIAMPVNVPFGTRMRWTISIRLIGAYVALQADDHDSAKTHLREIISFATNLSEWPSSLTNIMLAHYGLGYLALVGKDKISAESHFRDAINLFRYGCLVAKFPNAYSFGELGNALKIAEACFIGGEVCRLGAPIQDGNIAAPGTKIDPKILPAPLGWLLPKLEV